MAKKHIKMLYNISELNNLFTESYNIEEFLRKIVELVANQMNSEACSIFFYDNSNECLYLKASTNKFNIKKEKISVDIYDDFIGKSIKEYKSIISNDTVDSKILSEYFEDEYKSSLSVPILRGKIRFGVIVIQSSKENFFHNSDIYALKVIASQLAFLIENAKLFLSALKPKKEKKKIIDISDIRQLEVRSASKGVAYSEAIVLENAVCIENIETITNNLDFKLDDLNTALKRTELQLEKLQKEVENKLSDAASLIFTAHLLMLKDSSFIKEINKNFENGTTIPDSIIKTFYKYKKIFSNMTDPLIKEKIQDLEDLIIRILTNLIELKKKKITSINYNEKIIITRNLFPSDILKYSVENVKGIILIQGGITAHVSILTRSLNIPLVLSDNTKLLFIPEKIKIFLNANEGEILIEPEIDHVKNLLSETKEREKTLVSNDIKTADTKTKDFVRYKLLSNINLLTDLNILKDVNIDGIGLYRTEFPFLIRSDFPTEEEQFVNYKKLVDSMIDKEIAIRTLDIGGDKVLAYYGMEEEDNPFLGLRSIRFSLKHIDIFKEQIKAILRAGYKSDLKLLFPMISSLDEFIRAKEIVNECMYDLSCADIEHNNNVKIGMMVEVPSVINIIEDFVGFSDFFSIGTNDLIQYTLAVDRTNSKVSDFYIPHHPSILKSIKHVADISNKNNIEVTVCGDMANNEKYIPFLIGSGITSLSVDSIYVPRVKKIISELTIDYAKNITWQLLNLTKIKDIEEVLKSINLLNI